jgi:hypothetical protein
MFTSASTAAAASIYHQTNHPEIFFRTSSIPMVTSLPMERR